MKMNDFVIKTNNLVKDYGRKRAIDNLNINVNTGGIIGLIGRNGSGKTTFMKLCAGLLDKTQGSISVFGKVPMDNLEVLEKLVYTYHNIEYDKSAKLLDVLYGFDVMYKNFDKDFALKLVKYFDLTSKMKYKQLSQGMASIFNYICALSTRADLTMLDEPVLGMDITVRKAAYEVLLRDYTEHPRTIIISSHLLAELEGILSEIILIDKGSLVLYKDIDEVREMAYRVDGSRDSIDEYCQDKKILFRKSGEFDNFAIVLEVLTEKAVMEGRQRNISVSKVGAEDVCSYLIQDNKEGELQCLWAR